MSGSEQDSTEPVKVERRVYDLAQSYPIDAPILADRAELERRLTLHLIARMREDGVDIDPDTRLPGFVLAPSLGFRETHMTARISCEVAIMPGQARWPRG